jgi:tRNA U34 2-thiouridine synthase MnmA/TrmU
MPKAIALYSGGLDSTLSILVMKRLGVDVMPVIFITDFGCSVSRRSGGKSTLPAPETLGFSVEERYIGEEFLELVKNPKFGHGKNMNPCIDCKALMLREARQIMEERGADFLITGEVLGQRPMSQRRDTFPKIDKEAGVAGLVVRPLCARLLNPTLAEEKGLIDREKLYGFSGRSRKPQIALAKELGITEYPQPAGGCLLTDQIYSFRLRELLARNPSPSMREIQLLRLGRHFRTSDGFSIIVGRDERENALLEQLARPGEYALQLTVDYGSPFVLAEAGISEEGLDLAARLCVRYSSARRDVLVPVQIVQNETTTIVRTAPASEHEIEQFRIRPPDINN